MIVLVCGGRYYDDSYKMMRVMDKAHEKYMITEVVTGAASGADTLAEEWAKTNRIAYRGMPAQWDKWGRSAGAIRNSLMLDVYIPDMVIAFPGGEGTAHMINAAKNKNIKVVKVNE